MAENNHFLALSEISKHYDVGRDKQRLQVLDEINLSVQKGSFVSFFGPNGCGKSTIMQIISGVLKPDKGVIKFSNGNNVKKSLIFQNFYETLYPWMTCLDNIAFPLEMEGMGKERRREMVRNFVKEMELDNIPLHQYPYQCSGGQLQLVAMARALINNPDMLLMDEPFVALDHFTRTMVEQKLLAIWQKKKVTTLLVSHDIEEAIYLSDIVVVINKKPAKIIEEIQVNLPRPRSLKMMETSEFVDIKSKVLASYPMI